MKRQLTGGMAWLARVNWSNGSNVNVHVNLPPAHLYTHPLDPPPTFWERVLPGGPWGHRRRNAKSVCIGAEHKTRDKTKMKKRIEANS